MPVQLSPRLLEKGRVSTMIHTDDTLPGMYRRLEGTQVNDCMNGTALAWIQIIEDGTSSSVSRMSTKSLTVWHCKLLQHLLYHTYIMNVMLMCSNHDNSILLCCTQYALKGVSAKSGN